MLTQDLLTATQRHEKAATGAAIKLTNRKHPVQCKIALFNAAPG